MPYLICGALGLDVPCQAGGRPAPSLARRTCSGTVPDADTPGRPAIKPRRPVLNGPAVETHNAIRTMPAHVAKRIGAVRGHARRRRGRRSVEDIHLQRFSIGTTIRSSSRETCSILQTCPARCHRPPSRKASPRSAVLVDEGLASQLPDLAAARIRSYAGHHAAGSGPGGDRRASPAGRPSRTSYDLLLKLRRWLQRAGHRPPLLRRRRRRRGDARHGSASPPRSATAASASSGCRPPCSPRTTPASA